MNLIVVQSLQVKFGLRVGYIEAVMQAVTTSGVTYSALGNSAEILGADEGEGSRNGKNGSLETHVC